MGYKFIILIIYYRCLKIMLFRGENNRANIIATDMLGYSNIVWIFVRLWYLYIFKSISSVHVIRKCINTYIGTAVFIIVPGFSGQGKNPRHIAYTLCFTSRSIKMILSASARCTNNVRHNIIRFFFCRGRPVSEYITISAGKRL